MPGQPAYVELESSPAMPVLSAVLVLYRRSKETPVHAVAAEVWSGSHQVGEVKPVHCMGMRGHHVSAYIRDMLENLRQQFGVTRFEDVVKEVPVSQCPLDPCPFKSQGI